MKKFLALVLALALCAGLCACGQEKTPESDAPRSDVSATPIPKPSAGGTEAPKETPAAPAATEKPAPPDIYVTEKCDITGTLVDDQGYYDYFSYILPQINGAQTDCIQAANAEIDRIYDGMVAPSLEAMQDPDGYPECYCAAYSHTMKDGVHSILITCDSDWGQDSYWCFNFDEYGEAADNEALLALAGMTPDQFVKTARDILTEATDLSEYFEDDGWKELQKQTIADDNCNADMPMAFLPDGRLCFIATVYTPAGAGAYDCVFPLNDDGTAGEISLGQIAADQLWGTYLVKGEDLKRGEEDGGDTDYALEFLRVGDTLTAQITAYEPESGSVYYYFAADIYPEDPADLLNSDGRSFPVRVLSYCPDIFGGSYYGEAGLYTMTIDEDSVTFSDFCGGTPFLAEEFTAWYVYSDELMLENTIPEMDYERFDYTQVEDSGITGIWTGAYTDLDYREHSLTLELTNYGQLWMRDCVEGEIPRIMGGRFYIAGEGDDFAAAEGMVVFHLVTVGGFKEPYMGACWIYLDDDGRLVVFDTDDETSMNMLLSPTEYICCMERVPRVRTTAMYSSVTLLAEGDVLTEDIWGTGHDTEYSYTFVRDKNAGDVITSILFSLDGEEVSLDDLWLYDAKVYVAEPGRTGPVYFYIDGQTDNDYHYTDIVGANDEYYWLAGSFSGGFGGEPFDPNCMVMRSRCSLLSTTNIYRSYRLGLNGLPEPIDPFFHTDSSLTLTAKKDVDAWKVDAESGELVYDITLAAGTEVSFLRTDGRTFWDLEAENGDCYRVWVDSNQGWSQTVGGENITDCFDGTMFAG